MVMGAILNDTPTILNDKTVKPSVCTLLLLLRCEPAAPNTMLSPPQWTVSSEP